MDQKILLQRYTVQQSFLLYPRDDPKTKKQLSANQAPQWLLNRYQDESYISVSALPENKDKHLRLWYRIIKKLGFIYPESTLLLFWNLLMVTAIILNYYEIPVAMFFTSAVYYSQFQSGVSLALNTLFTTCIFINILFIRPLTAYYDSGRLITTRKLMFNRYLKLEFWLNIISWISLLIYIFANNPSLVYVKLLFYLSSVCLYRMDKLILYKVQIWRIRSALYKLLRLICMLLVVLFWIGSIFFAIDYHYYLEQNQYYPVNLWLTNTQACQYSDQSYINLVQTYSWPVWLNYSMYWVLQTVSGVGYGDITPRNPVEVAYCDVVIVIFCLFYALFVNSVWQILVELLGNSRDYKKKILKYYQRNYHLDREMIVKLENYIYETTQAQEKQEKEKLINQNLSPQLRNQLLLARQKKLFIGISYFNKLAEALPEEYAEFLYSLANRTKEVRHGQGEIIFSSGCWDAKLCLLALGEVKLWYSNTKLTRLVKNQDKVNFFGVADFICRTSSNFSAQALKYSKISELSQEQFIQSTKQNHKIKQKCQELFQNIKFYDTHELSSENCWTCSRTIAHPTHKCPQFFQWLTLYRNPIQIQKQKQLRKSGYTFRNFRYRKCRKSKKINIKKSKLFKFQQNRLFQQKQGESGKIFANYVDLLVNRNKNIVDQVRKFTDYRILSNL